MRSEHPAELLKAAWMRGWEDGQIKDPPPPPPPHPSLCVVSAQGGQQRASSSLEMEPQAVESWGAGKPLSSFSSFQMLGKLWFLLRN